MSEMADLTNPRENEVLTHEENTHTHSFRANFESTV